MSATTSLNGRHRMAAAEAGLHLIEACVFAVVDAAPRLATRQRRRQLRELMQEIDSSFTADRVGKALAHVRTLAQAGVIETMAFRPDAAAGEPTREACEAAFLEVSRLFGRGGGTNVARVERRRAHFLAHFGLHD